MAKTLTPTAGKSAPCPHSKNGFQEPDLNWLEDQFKNIRIGAMKASELEIILAYQLMWKAGNLTKSPYDIAREYGYTEAKASRLLQEFACRFHKEEGDSAFLGRLWDSITGKDASETGDSIVPIVQGTDILLSIQSPYDRNRLRHIVESKGLPWIGDFNKKLVRLPLFILVYVFQGQSPKFKDAIQKAREQFLKKTGLQKASMASTATYYVKRGAEFIAVASRYLGPLQWMAKHLTGN